MDVQSKTLTLENATIEQTSQTPGAVVLRIDNGELKIVLKGVNKIVSTDQRPIYGMNADITIQGTDTLTVESSYVGIQFDVSNLTIDGCTVNVNVNCGEYSVGIVVNRGWNGNTEYGGALSIRNHATVIVTAPLFALHGMYGVSIHDSNITATANGREANAIYSQLGKVEITNSDLTAITISEESYPAVYATAGFDLAASNVTISSNGALSLYSPNRTAFRGRLDLFSAVFMETFPKKYPCPITLAIF